MNHKNNFDIKNTPEIIQKTEEIFPESQTGNKGINYKYYDRMRYTKAGQLVYGYSVLMSKYFFTGTKIKINGTENLPDENAIYALNHNEDRFGYWPFQYKLGDQHDRFTTTLIKPKYYLNQPISWGLDVCANTPLPTLKDNLTLLFKSKFPKIANLSPEEYGVIKGLIDTPEQIKEINIEELRDEVRYMIENLDLISDYHDEIGKKVMESLTKAVQKKLDILIYPEGTRSKTLGQGRIGAILYSLFTDKPIVPVGDNGSDKIYGTRNAPIPKFGHKIAQYEMGNPIYPQTFKEILGDIGDDPQYHTREFQKKHAQKLQECIDLVMQELQKLLKPEYLPTT